MTSTPDACMDDARPSASDDTPTASPDAVASPSSTPPAPPSPRAMDLPDDIRRRDYPYLHYGAQYTPEATTFRVHAPAATAVDLLCSRHGWRHEPMERDEAGDWSTQVLGIEPGDEYKYFIRNENGYLPKPYQMARIDPFSAQLAAHHDEHGAATYNSVVCDPASFTWTHKHRTGHGPMAIYELHLSTFWNAGYREIAEKIVGHVGYLGFTHVQVMPPFQTPLHESWGYLVGCPYAISERYGTLDDWKWMVNHLHAHDIGVIVDIPLGFGVQNWDCGLANYDGTDLYHHSGERGWNRQWQTRIYNQSAPHVRDYLAGLLTYAHHELGVDGVRVDAVSSQIFLDYDRGVWNWTRNDKNGLTQEHWDLFNSLGGDMWLDRGYWISEAVDFDGLFFLRDMHLRLAHTAPGLFTIAEESRRVFPRLATPVDQGGLGFTYAQNMGEMHRVRKYLTLPTHEKRIDVIEKIICGDHDERFVNAMNTHDECANGKTRLITELGNHVQLIGLAALCWFRPGAPMIFMGDEFCEEGWFDVHTGLDWTKTGPGAALHQQQMLANIHDLNAILRREPALARPESWTLCRSGSNNEVMYFSFIRWGGTPGFQSDNPADHKDDLVYVRNEMPHQLCRAAEVYVPCPGEYRVIYNSIDERYIGRQGYNEHDPYWTIHAEGNHLFLEMVPYQNIVLKLV